MADPIEMETNEALSPDVNPVLADTEAVVGPTVTEPVEDIGSGFANQADYLSNQVAGEQPSYVAPTEALDNITVNPGAETYMTPETTVAGQLERLLDQGGPLQQQAQRQERERASALGMMSSTDYIGAARAADVTALQPVAKADADTAKAFQGAQQATENKMQEVQAEAEVAGALTEQKAAIAEQQAYIDQSFQSTLKGLDAQLQADMTDLKGQWENSFRTLQGDIERELKQQDIDAGTELQLINNANQVANDTNISIQQLLGNKEFLDSMPSTSAMHGVFNDMWAGAEASIRYQARAAGVYEDVSGYIDELSAGFKW